MRIISGRFKGQKFNPPVNLPYRPTTDIAKSGLFNIIANQWDFEEVILLDLFTGTGSISYEFASRGCKDITSIDAHPDVVKYVRSMRDKLNIRTMDVMQSDAMKFLKSVTRKFNFIFAGPPYAYPYIPEIPQVVFERSILSEGGWLVVEHNDLLSLDHLPYFSTKRNYGSTVFSFFTWSAEES